MANLISTWDLALVGIFFLITLVIGLIERKKITLEDYWVNGRKTGKYALLATILSTFVGAAAILGNAGISYSGGGLAALFIVGSFFFYFFIFSKFFSSKVKDFGDRHNAYTIPDFLGARYSEKVRIASSIVNLVTYVLYLALQILGMGVFVSALSGFDPTIATVIGGLIVITYTSVGGLRADIRTDIFQFIVMFFLIVPFLPMLIYKAGGFGAISSLPASFLAGAPFAPWYVFLFAFLFVGSSILASSDIWQRSYAADNPKNLRLVMKISAFLVLLFLSTAVLIGVYGKVLLPGAEPNMIIPALLKMVLPAGLFGLVIAGFFAAIMSSADTMLLVASMTLVHDIYMRTFKRDMPPEKVLSLSRKVTFLLGLAGLAAALIIFNIVHLSIEATSFHVILIPAIVFGFYWSKATPQAAFWSIAAGFITIVAFLFISPVQAFIPGLIVGFLTFLTVNYFVRRRMRKNWAAAEKNIQRAQ